VSHDDDRTGRVELRAAAETEPLRLGAGAISFVAPGSVTDGRFGLFEYSLAARSPGAGPHYHQTFAESFFVLSGELTVLAEDRWRTAGAGDLVHVFEGGVHGFRNDGDDPARFLILFAPGIARERYFEELAKIGQEGGARTEEEIASIFVRHDQVNVDDPPPPS